MSFLFLFNPIDFSWIGNATVQFLRITHPRLAIDSPRWIHSVGSPLLIMRYARSRVANQCLAGSVAARVGSLCVLPVYGRRMLGHALSENVLATVDPTGV